MTLYLDTSSLVKLFIDEPGSDLVGRMVGAATVVVTSTVAYPESRAAFARLRRECPVAHTHGLGGFWALTRYDDVKRAASDPATFITSVQNVIPRVAFTGRRPPLRLPGPARRAPG